MLPLLFEVVKSSVNPVFLSEITFYFYKNGYGLVEERKGEDWRSVDGRVRLVAKWKQIAGHKQYNL